MTTPLPMSPVHFGFTSPGSNLASQDRFHPCDLLTTGEEVERKGRRHLLRTHRNYDRVPCVVSAGTTGTDVELSRQDVDELALALVAPLRAEDHGH